MKRTALIIVLFAAAAADAETQQKPAATTTLSGAQPALISDVQAGNQDSPLVQAAKRALRRKTGTAPIAVITDETVARATTVLTTSSGGAEIPVFAAADTHTRKTSDPAPAAAAQSAAARRMSKAGQDPYAVRVPSATDSCEPQPSQNTGPNRPPNP